MVNNLRNQNAFLRYFVSLFSFIDVSIGNITASREESTEKNCLTISQSTSRWSEKAKKKANETDSFRYSNFDFSVTTGLILSINASIQVITLLGVF